MPRSNELVKKKVSNTTTDPMAVYREVSDWKGKCGRLIDRLRCILSAANIKDAKEQANKAIKEFEENK